MAQIGTTIDLSKALAWLAAENFVASNSSMRVRTVTATLIDTYPPIVIGEIGMKVEMIAGEIGEDRGGKIQSVHPLLGERQYRFGSPAPAPGLPRLDRQALHAWRLGFRHPSTGRPVVVTADLPEDLRRVLAALRSRR